MYLLNVSGANDKREGSRPAGDRKEPATRLGRPALLLLVLLVALLSTAAPALSWEAGGDGTPPRPEGRLVYDVLRRGDDIGTLTLDFRPSGEGSLVVRTRMEIAVSWLSITVFRFRHDAEELWRDGRLVALSSRTNDDGRKRRVELRREGERLRGTYNGKARDLPGDLLPASLWHPGTILQSALLDPIKGRSREIDVRDRGEEKITVDGRAVVTHHYSITGQIKRELWYGPDGHLLQVRFPAEDGSEITFILRSSTLKENNDDIRATGPLSFPG